MANTPTSQKTRGEESSTHYPGSPTSHGTTPHGGSMTDKAKDMASSVAEKAREAASSVADTASNVGHKVADTASGFASNVGHKVEGATSAVGDGMKSLAGTIREKAPHSGMLGSASSSVADSLESSGRYIQEQGLGGIAEDLTNIVRRNPIPALFVGIGIGFLLARATRS